MIKYKFTRYERNYFRGDTRIGINKSGLIRLSSGFSRITNVANFKYVVLFYDTSNKAIAFKFTNTQENGALKVTKDRTSATISAISFIKANNLNPKNYSGRYDWKKLSIPSIGEVYIIDITKK